MSYQEVPDVETGDAWPAEYNDDYVKGNMELTPAAVVTTKGDLFVATGNQAGTRLPVGSDTQTLESRSTESTGRKWVASGLVPVGGILIWSGTLVDIPANWQICDGTNGTPDLRNCFIVGSGSTYATNDEGGAGSLDLEHSHTLSSPTGSNGAHTHNQPPTDVEGSHTHSISGNTGIGDTAAQINLVTGATSVAKTDHVHSVSGATDPGDEHYHTNPTTGSSGSHTHIIADPGTNNQLSATQSLLPPYYALALIMRMA